MTTTVEPILDSDRPAAPVLRAERPQTLWRQVLRSRRVVIGGGILLAIMLLCFLTLPWTTREVSPAGVPVQTGKGVA
ncbi:MAG TPA: hypothetical protein VH475_08395, partial [Tepidisphaeraceae bacterium]